MQKARSLKDLLAHTVGARKPAYKMTNNRLGNQSHLGPCTFRVLFPHLQHLGHCGTLWNFAESTVSTSLDRIALGANCYLKGANYGLQFCENTMLTTTIRCFKWSLFLNEKKSCSLTSMFITTLYQQAERYRAWFTTGLAWFYTYPNKVTLCYTYPNSYTM